MAQQEVRSGSLVKDRILNYESSHVNTRQSSGVQPISSTDSITHRSVTTTNGSAVINGSGYVDTYAISKNLVNDTIESEKARFISLNDRLAKYIEAIRELTISHGEITVKIKENKAMETQLREQFKAIYNKIIKEGGHCLDDMEKKKQDWSMKVTQIKSKYSIQVKTVNDLEDELRKIIKKRQTLLIEIEEITKEIKVLEIRMKAYQANGDIVIDQAILNKVKVQITTTREKIELKKKEYNKIKSNLVAAEASHRTEIEQLRSTYSEKIRATTAQIKVDYEARLWKALQELRAYFRAQLQGRHIKDITIDIDIDFNAKHLVEEVFIARREIFRLKFQKTELEARIASQRAIIAALNQQIDELKILSHYGDNVEAVYSQIIVHIENEVKHLKEQYSYLSVLRVRLQNELDEYHRLLSAEEARYGIYNYSTASTENYSDASKSVSHSEIDVVIDRIDMNGNCIQLSNNGTKDFNLSSWMIKANANNKIAKYRFQAKQVLPAGKSMTIWSPGRGGTNNPPYSIVTVEVVWPAGNTINVELLDEHEKVKAWFTAYGADEIKSSNTNGYTVLQKSTQIL